MRKAKLKTHNVEQAKNIEDILAALRELLEDVTVPRNVKNKLQRGVIALQDNSADISMRIDKALQELDEIADDANLQTYTRTQIWNIVSMLEKL